MKKETFKQENGEKFSYTGKWYLTCCTHEKAFEIELPLIKFFRFEWLRYKQYICPNCKKVAAKPWAVYIWSEGDGTKM